MQKITLICMGKASGFYAEAIRDYEKRLLPLCKFKAVEMAEEPVREKQASPAVIDAALDKEAGRILAALPPKAVVWALCVEGKQRSSEELASQMQEYALGGEGEMAFVIGSSHGLAPRLKEKARHRFSLSRMTFPHQLARLMLTEQIYRAFQIGAGSRYHK